LVDWIKDLIKKYNIDGIRIDTVPEVPKWFWTEFANAAGVYQVGEVFDGRLEYVADYQNYIDAVLNYPLFFSLRNAFLYNNSMRQIESTLATVKSKFKDHSVLGNFIDNHDNGRFLHYTGNNQNFKNAIVFSLLTGNIIY
jgi:alpha-amylase